MGGDVLYHLEDVGAAGLAQHPCVVARWDRVHAATRTCERRGVEYGAAIERVDVPESGSLALTVARGGGGAAAAAAAAVAAAAAAAAAASAVPSSSEKRLFGEEKKILFGKSRSKFAKKSVRAYSALRFLNN